MAGAAAMGSTALSYGRIIGANDRISVGHIGVGNRGRELASILAGLKDRSNLEMTAVCDLWKVNRERAGGAGGGECLRADAAIFPVCGGSAGVEGCGHR